MISKRIIPCLDVKNGRVVKGVNFEGIQDVADPVEMAEFYNQRGAIKNPELITEAAHRYGDQCVVLSMDVKRVGDEYHVFKQGGRVDTGIDALEWAESGVRRGAGELVVNSIDTDGVKQGFDIPMLLEIAKRVDVPIIASGGAGKKEDFLDLFQYPQIDAGLAASIFHRKEVNIKELKQYLAENGVEMRLI